MTGAMGVDGTGEAFRIEVRKARVWRRGGHIVVMIVALALLLIMLEVHVGLALFAGVALELWRRIRAALWARARPAVIRAGVPWRDEVVIERDGSAIVVRRDQITDSWHMTDAETDAVEVFVLTRHLLVSLRVPDAATAEALDRALGVDTESRLVSTSLSAAPTLPKPTVGQAVGAHWRDLAIVLASTAALILVVLNPIARASAALLPLILFVTVAAVRPRYRVLVGRDGLLVITPEQRRFVGFERITHVTDGFRAIGLKLDNGQEIALPLTIPMGGFGFGKPHPLRAWFRDVDHVLARRRTLVRQIKDALARFRAAGADGNAETAARLLDRGDRSFGEWRQALGLEHTSTYRAHELDSNQLVNVLENPRIPLGQRLGAALALAERSDRDAAGLRQSRVRAAIASSANPKVRIALERAVDGKLEDADYQRALDAEAEAERVARKTRRVKA